MMLELMARFTIISHASDKRIICDPNSTMYEVSVNRCEHLNLRVVSKGTTINKHYDFAFKNDIVKSEQI